ncbi:BamA/TamA family outer membrane protein [Variovorax dokdonensis]|uniref:BamA/TamA family outer membrane protein n=1 Tax=Variovorax dokdonensis TaxID=344883 RepID=A0ABT7ND64_9BURK|nr:BamA/TamA family outer membrane protein [Variovorax dokdonensis]MDM0045862.1 BamA/TamA family outer membrane protein [Variovorax dokdonensis]
MTCLVAHAQSDSSTSAGSMPDGSTPKGEQAGSQSHDRSPWLLVPLVSSNPKLGTSAGGMVGYVTRFDEQSEPSLFAVQGQTSNTSSTTVAVGSKAFWNADRERLSVGAVGGKVSNDYLDFLGTGREVRSDENLRAFFVRYQHEVLPNWYVGAQALYANYAVDGLDPTSDLILEQAGLAGLVSAGAGLITSYDTRDNTNNPTSGVYAQLHNLAYRESLGSDDNYDALTADIKWYATTGKNNVLVAHAKGRWTKDAPASRESTVQLRGYTSGQYLGRNALTLEVEDRYMVLPRWGVKAFAGVSCLYGDGKSCSGDQVYPMVGGGVFFIVKPEANMVVSAEFAKGKDENQGFYLTFGHRF